MKELYTHSITFKLDTIKFIQQDPISISQLPFPSFPNPKPEQGISDFFPPYHDPGQMEAWEKDMLVDCAASLECKGPGMLVDRAASLANWSAKDPVGETVPPSADWLWENAKCNKRHNLPKTWRIIPLRRLP